MALNWYDIASKTDIRAHDFYEKLLLAKSEGYSWIDTWVKVPKKLVNELRRDGYADGAVDAIWDGFDWQDVFTYEDDGKVYVRLPQPHEVVDAEPAR